MSNFTGKCDVDKILVSPEPECGSTDEDDFALDMVEVSVKLNQTTTDDFAMQM